MTRTPCYLIAALLAFLCACKPQAEEAPPNIIYILADDLGYGELGCYGQEKIETPHLDALAASGMRFTQHYAGSPVCAPSRCVLLTGRHTGHAYIRGNDEWRERGEVWNYAKAVENPELEGQRPIPDVPTIGSMLQAAGYRTAIVGKWGLGAPLTEGIPNKRGFDFFYGYNCQRQAHNLYPRHLWRNQEKEWLNNELIVPGTKLEPGADTLDPGSYARFIQQDYAPAKMLDAALEFMEQNKHEPFFLYFASPLTHVPLQVPPAYVETYHQKFGDERPYLGQRGYFPHRYPRAAYAAMLSYLDEQVGALVAKLKEMGVYERTLIIFSSDNGPSYNGGTDSPFFNSAGPFKCEYGWGKGFTHEGGIRVPMIASWPGKISAGSETDHISAFYDVMPTLAEVAGIQQPPESDGISFLPSLLGRGKQLAHEYLYWEFPAYKGQQAVRMGKWKGIRRNIFEGNMDIELYDLEKDLQELHDVAEAQPEVVARMAEIMQQAHTPASIARFRFPQLGDPQ
ncbi:MAG: N-acetylgalactosamine-6-sulfatase [Bacteroidetes bacterium]|nr:MAG: N-acetylgalactosamine-6-sulfatase [Bacteroidota bacterium]